MDTRWMLPEGISELLPGEAESVEQLRRAALDLFSSWGYQLVEPPLVEYLESLLTGMGRDLDVQTFKLVDQYNGRTMGVRADITPQVTRIEAHRLRRDVPTRLCYIGPVLHARGNELGGNRNPLQLGAELYGHQGLASDLEVVNLMLDTLRLAGMHDAYVNLGHVAIFRGLAAGAGLDAAQTQSLFDMVQRKSTPEVEAFLAAQHTAAGYRQMFTELLQLNGGGEVLDRAEQVLASAGSRVLDALQHLRELGARLARACPDIVVHYDLGEIRAYQYETGLVFAAYREGHGQEVARGGRYDDVGAAFGRASPATGFSMDLRLLARSYHAGDGAMSILAPADDDDELRRILARLRSEGKRVVCELPGQALADPVSMGCTHQLVRGDNGWQVVACAPQAHPGGKTET